MKKSWAVMAIVIAFTAGAVGAHFLTVYKERKRGLMFLQAGLTSDLYYRDRCAYQAYRTAPPEAGIWALADFLKQSRMYEARLKDFPFSMNGDVYAGYTHARIARLYRQVGDEAAAREHLQKAMEIIRQDDPETIFKTLDAIDRKMDEEYNVTPVTQ